MIGFVGLDLFRGPNALATGTSAVGTVNRVRIANAIFDHLNVSANTSDKFSTEIPTEWVSGTYMNASFNGGNTNAGNFKLNIAGLQKIKIKRRLVGSTEWILLTTIDINGDTDKLEFAYPDTLTASNTEYEYAFVPVINGAEGDYITSSIVTKFNGVFIGDEQTTYRFLYDVEFGTLARNSPTGTFEPLGRKYPVIVSNGSLSYDTGSFTGDVINDDYEDTGVLDSQAIVAKRKALEDFLAHHSPKILKDWNGNIWLCMITGKITSTFLNGSSLRVPKLTAEWTEIGDANSVTDLFEAGLLKEMDGGT